MRSSLMGVLDALAIVPVLAQAPEGVHIRIRGTVDRLEGRTLVVRTVSGQSPVTIGEGDLPRPGGGHHGSA